MRNSRRYIVAFATLFILLVLALAGAPGESVSASSGGPGDADTLAMMHEINEELAAAGMNVAIEEISYFTIGQGRPSDRILQQPFRWVPGDERRNADGNNITYLVDQSDGATASSLSNADTEAAIDRSFDTWQADSCLRSVDLVKRADAGDDPDIFDAFFGFGGVGNPFLADIVNAGWLPRAFFDAVTGAPDNVLAFSVTFIFLDDDGNPTDVNGDNYLDTALNEVYYNDTFGTPGEPREGFPWGIDVDLPGIDVETVALHENGHSLGVGHFGPPPNAVMNPVYAGIRHDPFPTDHSAMCTTWSSWPSR
jgi:hypothetical protein